MLRRLHSDQTLTQSTLDYLRGLNSDEIVQMLAEDGPERLRIRPDGTVLQGNHRVKVLEERNYDMASLYAIAEVIEKEAFGWENEDR